MRPIADSSLQAVLALNNEHQRETSRLSLDELRALVRASFVALESGEGREGFIIALQPGAAYNSPNFRWFEQRYDRFVYVDRIVVAAPARGKGLARAFYQALFDRARLADARHIACEVNVDPPNPASDAFHGRMGFVEVGHGLLSDRGKTVRYLMKSLTDQA